MTAPRPLPGLAETEAGFMGWIIDYAHIRRWRVAHFRPAMTVHGWRTPVQADGAGWPDLILVRAPRIIAAEVKIDAKTERARTRQLTAEQLAWLEVLGQCPGLEVAVWRPADRPTVEQVLR